jgi:hypothetical protein
LEDTNLSEVHLEGANLIYAHLERSDLDRAHLEEADLRLAHLEAAILNGTYMSASTKLRDIALGNNQLGFVCLAAIHWDDVNLSYVNWAQMKVLGDEFWARQKQTNEREKRYIVSRLDKYRVAVRANRHLSVVLREQGLNEEADHFAYRAQLLQRTVWRLQRRPLKFLLSWFLFLLAGYGYRPLRSLIAYLVIIFGFMGLYLLNAHFVAPHLRWDEALVLSVSSFHGRGFFTQNVTLGDTYARIAAIEAILGLFIEISFIATFTQRFFGR